MKSKIARRLALYFAAALLLFSAVIGAVFISLFRAQTVREHREDLEARAVSIAGALSEYMGGSGVSGSGSSGRGMMGGGAGGYGAYLRFIDDIAMADVWIVDEDLNLITNSQMSGAGYNYADLPENAGEVVQDVFAGQTTFSEDFSSLLSVPTLTVGTPITSGGQIVGAVLLHSPVEGMDDAAARGVWILLVSILVSLILSAVLSAFLALKFTRPLNRMKDSALRLAEGDYSAETGVTQADEIGELAAAIDALSARLSEARAESEKLEKLRRDFTANISHELKTPVTVIRGSLEALCDGVVTEPGQVADYHRRMLDESLSLQRLVSDLLDLSRLQNTDFKMEMQSLNLCDVLHDAVRSAGQLADGKGVGIRTGFDTDCFPVSGDYGRLRQMFLIVLDNAVKFSPAGSAVDVALKNGTVSVRDRGAGIAAEDLPHIFDRFYKARSEENKNGSGLGLAIARQIAERHGIRIEAVSRPGEGAEFRFEFRRSAD